MNFWCFFSKFYGKVSKMVYYWWKYLWYSRIQVHYRIELYASYAPELHCIHGLLQSHTQLNWRKVESHNSTTHVQPVLLDVKRICCQSSIQRFYIYVLHIMYSQILFWNGQMMAPKVLESLSSPTTLPRLVSIKNIYSLQRLDISLS